MTNATRCMEFDCLKFVAMFIVYSTHFIAFFNKSYFRLWHTGPSSIILGGVSGKLGVVIFGVILGFFAYRGGRKGTVSLIEYSLKRYGYFVWVGLLINIVWCIWQDKSFDQLLRVSFCVGKDIFLTYWCMRDFLFASIFAYYLGSINAGSGTKLVAILLLFLAGQLWIPICIMGTLIPDLMRSKVWNNKVLALLLFLLFFYLIKQRECALTFILDGIFTVVMICIIENSIFLRRCMSNKLIASLGARTMAIFVIHPILYMVIGNCLFGSVFDKTGIGFVFVWIFCWVVICVVSYPVTYIFNLYGKLFSICSLNLK